jgi:ADP-heptose:LPS heptosyltransferase
MSNQTTMDDVLTRLAAARFLVTRTDRLGDMVLSGPLFDAIKHYFPNSCLLVLASQVNADIASMHPAVDEVITDPVEARHSGSSGTLSLARILRRLRPDVIMFANSKHRLAVAAFMARIPIRIGSARRRYSILYNVRIPCSADPGTEHETDATLGLLAALGIACERGVAPRFRVPEAYHRSLDALFARQSVKQKLPIAVVHASNSGNAMTASAQWHARLVDVLSASGYSVMLTGTEKDRGLSLNISAAARCSPLDLSGRLTVGELAALLSRCAVCIGNSTGPTHLSASLGTPTIGLYAPLHKQKKWMPRGAAVAVLTPEVGMSCQTCLLQKCPYYSCMEHIKPESVLKAIEKVKRKKGQKAKRGR